MDSPFHVIPPEAIADGRATDAYFERTDETLAHAGKNPHVVAEVTADQFSTGVFRILAGVADVATLFEGVPVDIDTLPEGTAFDGGPVLRITGPYREFVRYETALLGLISQASAYATRALAARIVAGDTPLFSFGSRHVHPALAAVVERSALLAGFDGFSNVAAGDLLDREPGGTMPHSLMIVFGEDDIEAAWIAFDEAVDPAIPRIALCDTFNDERVESLQAARALGDTLEGVRLDTTGSRRGDFGHIVREVRWELDAAGFDDIGIFLSGGIDLEAIDALGDEAAGFGVGSYITSAPPIDFAMDIVEVDGRSTAKRGKLSGVKEVLRTPDGNHLIVPRDSTDDYAGERLFRPLVRDGAVVDGVDLDRAAAHALHDARRVDFDPWDHA